MFFFFFLLCKAYASILWNRSFLLQTSRGFFSPWKDQDSSVLETDNPQASACKSIYTVGPCPGLSSQCSGCLQLREIWSHEGSAVNSSNSCGPSLGFLRPQKQLKYSCLGKGHCMEDLEVCGRVKSCFGELKGEAAVNSTRRWKLREKWRLWNNEGEFIGFIIGSLCGYYLFNTSWLMWPLFPWTVTK